MVLFKQYKDFENTSALKKKKKKSTSSVQDGSAIPAKQTALSL